MKNRIHTTDRHWCRGSWADLCQLVCLNCEHNSAHMWAWGPQPWSQNRQTRLLCPFWVESNSNRASLGYRFQVAHLGVELGGWWQAAGGWIVASDLVLSPRGRIAGILLVTLFMVAPILFLLPSAPSDMCPGFLLYEGSAISSFYHEVERHLTCKVDV